jgi:hypothetical protein
MGQPASRLGAIKTYQHPISYHQSADKQHAPWQTHGPIKAIETSCLQCCWKMKREQLASSEYRTTSSAPMKVCKNRNAFLTTKAAHHQACISAQMPVVTRWHKNTLNRPAHVPTPPERGHTSSTLLSCQLSHNKDLHTPQCATKPIWQTHNEQPVLCSAAPAHHTDNTAHIPHPGRVPSHVQGFKTLTLTSAAIACSQ